MAKFLFASSQKCDSPLEVTRFEFTIKSCRCTKTCEGVGTSDFCKAEIAPLPYNSEIITNSEHGRTLFAPTVIWASPTTAKSLRSLRIYIALRARKAVQILFLRYHFHLISYFYLLLILQSAPCRLTPNEALPHTPTGLCPVPTSPLAPGLSVRFISRFARCFILCLQFTLVCYAHSSFLISHSSLKSPLRQFFYPKLCYV